MQGRPVKEDSPWILLKISLTVNIPGFYTNRAGGSPSNGRTSCCWRNFRYLNRFKAIPVELRGEFIYHIVPLEVKTFEQIAGYRSERVSYFDRLRVTGLYNSLPGFWKVI
jgi:hypothetical protein